jgi:hypothetical protein
MGASYNPVMRLEVKRSLRAVRIAAADPRIPRPLRALVAVGLLPVPGPFDEAVLLVAGGVLFGFYRGPLRAAWQQAGEDPTGSEVSPARQES